MIRKIILLFISLSAVNLCATAPDIEMVFVKGGSFLMGNERGRVDEKPQHKVSVDSFYISKYEVTQKEWQAVTGNNPSFFIGENHPVERVNWYEAIEFCNAYSEMKNLKPCYEINRELKDEANLNRKDKYRWTVKCDWNADGYRLPTEAEWEYAAGGGNKKSGTAFSGSNNINEVAWYLNNAGNESLPDHGTRDVGQKKPNALGIYDMTGNVWEWCWDWYGAYGKKSFHNPYGNSYGQERVRRGGSWHVKTKRSTITTRNFRSPAHRSTHYGIRLVRRAK